MAGKREALRDWHRLFGLLLIDLFSGSPFAVEVEADLSVQQQLLDVVIVRWGRGRFSGRLPDGLEGLLAHNLITFKSHREALDTSAMKELVGHYVAYREFVGFGGRAYQRHSPNTGGLLVQLFEGLHAEGFAMPFTMEDFQRQFVKEHFPKLTPEEQEEVLQALPPEKRLAGLTEEQIRQYLDRLSAECPAALRKRRRKT